MSPPLNLDVALVESLQRAIQRGRSVSSVDRLESPTIAGLLEYHCLRTIYPAFDLRLSQTIRNSVQARALEAIGFLDHAEPLTTWRSTATRTLAVQNVEFAALPIDESLLGNVEWESFFGRFERSVRSVGFSPKSALEFHSAFKEMAENSIVHSQARIPCLMGYAVLEGNAQFTVADVGIGVKASLAQNPLYAQLSSDVEAIQHALKLGVTSGVGGAGGYGFQSVFKALAEQWGELRFRSGNGCIAMDGTAIDADHCTRSFPPPLPGFQVSVCCRLAPPARNSSQF